LNLPGDYNLRRDFSITQNPSGPWSYGWKTTWSNEFKRFGIPRRDIRDQEAFGDYQHFSWCEEPGREPTLMYHPGFRAVSIGTRDSDSQAVRTWKFAPACLQLIPTYGGQYRENSHAGVRFSAPEPGRYEFRARFFSFPHFERHQDLRTEILTVRDGTLLERTLLGPGEQSLMTNMVTLETGATIDFLSHNIEGRDRTSAVIECDIAVYSR
jgi:hypothetical protein